jgi:predicted RNA-binding Zn-ribbon protein involved in translation (DUF1610 family)
MNENENQDVILKCVSCGGNYILTPGERKFYIEDRGFNLPKRCSACRRARRSQATRAQDNPQGKVNNELP